MRAGNGKRMERVMTESSQFRQYAYSITSSDPWYLLMWLTTFMICASLSYYASLFI
jgi:hypothetical protein